MAASAAPLTTTAPPVDLSNRSGSMVQKIHDWHRYCEWGPRRFHRHIPGVGNVRCRRHRRRYRRRISRCEAWFNECRSRWGRRSWRFDRCMVRHGC
ncbi:MAG: hypothetical protein ACR2PI_21100 [Hyphomicrobiaceae bacterium]